MAIGLEVEFPGWSITYPDAFDAHRRLGNGIVVEGRSFNVVVEDWNKPRPFVEVVSKPLQAVPGDVGRIARDAFLEDLDQLRTLMRGLEGNRRFSDVFTPQDGFRVRRDFTEAQISRAPDAADIMEVQFTVGVPVTGLFDVLVEARENTPEDAFYLRQHIDIGLNLGNEMAALFIQQSTPALQTLPLGGKLTALMRDDEDVSAVRGFLALTYTQVASLGYWVALEKYTEFDRSLLSKNLMAVASRTSLQGIREGLSENSRMFLRCNAAIIKDAITRHFKNGLLIDGEFGEVFRAAGEFDVLSWRLPPDFPPIGEYLNSALFPMPHMPLSLTQKCMHGMLTDFDSLDDNQGRISIPLALLELRYYGNDRMTPTDMRGALERLTQHVQKSYSDAESRRALPPASQLPARQLISRLVNSSDGPAASFREFLSSVTLLQTTLPQVVNDGLLLPDSSVSIIASGVSDCLAGPENRFANAPVRDGIEAAHAHMNGLNTHLSALASCAGPANEAPLARALSTGLALERHFAGTLARGLAPAAPTYARWAAAHSPGSDTARERTSASASQQLLAAARRNVQHVGGVPRAASRR
jgi:hypothetical protein